MRSTSIWPDNAIIMPDGVLNINKPRGPTSHDIVALVRKLTDTRRVGHAGTLDPLASGVLVVCVGRPATRIAEYLMGSQKTYRADARLGAVSETYDAEGEIVAEAPVNVKRDDVETALARFRGKVLQTPPMYSAVKHKGKPLHRLARRGVEIEREPREVEIHRLELVAWNPPSCALDIVCSSGTYVRSLVHDLGQALGCGAYVTELVRLASGSFRLEDAVTPEALIRAADEGRWHQLLCPIDEAIADRFPALHLDLDAARKLCSGQAVEREKGQTTRDTDLIRAYGPHGRFLALAAYDPESNVWRPHKVFFPSYPENTQETEEPRCASSTA